MTLSLYIHVSLLILIYPWVQVPRCGLWPCSAHVLIYLYRHPSAFKSQDAQGKSCSSLHIVYGILPVSRTGARDSLYRRDMNYIKHMYVQAAALVNDRWISECHLTVISAIFWYVPFANVSAAMQAGHGKKQDSHANDAWETKHKAIVAGLSPTKS